MLVMQRKLFLLFVFFFHCLFCFSQRKTFEDYYEETKSFLSKFKTYELVVVRHDTTFVPKYDFQKNQLKIVFSFLHQLRESKKNPDLVVKIIIEDSSLQVYYTLLSSSQEEDKYKIRWSGDLKFIVQFDAGEKGSVTVPLCGFMHFEKDAYDYPVTLKNSSFGSTNPDRNWNNINFWISITESYLKTKSDFREEFTAALKAFAQDKCK